MKLIKIKSTQKKYKNINKRKNEKELNESKILIIDLMKQKKDCYYCYLISFFSNVNSKY